MNRRKLLKIIGLSAVATQVPPVLKTVPDEIRPELKDALSVKQSIIDFGNRLEERRNGYEINYLYNGKTSKGKVTPYKDKDGTWFLKTHPFTLNV